jgi:hypothetical protein
MNFESNKNNTSNSTWDRSMEMPWPTGKGLANDLKKVSAGSKKLLKNLNTFLYRSVSLSLYGNSFEYKKSPIIKTSIMIIPINLILQY